MILRRNSGHSGGLLVPSQGPLGTVSTMGRPPEYLRLPCRLHRELPVPSQKVHLFPPHRQIGFRVVLESVSRTSSHRTDPSTSTLSPVGFGFPMPYRRVLSGPRLLDPETGSPLLLGVTSNLVLTPYSQDDFRGHPLRSTSLFSSFRLSYSFVNYLIGSPTSSPSFSLPPTSSSFLSVVHGYPLVQ